ncbi:MAG: STAS domain-containing protein [Candidatus Riflebacteria bacterium]|nr:STAS domain-containing protein [Candidatus Riflebacteria bacterium]
MSPTAFTCTTHQDGDCFIVRPVGYLDQVAGKAIRAFFEPPLGQGVRKFILNLEGAPVINSQGITELLELVENLQYDFKAVLALVGLSNLHKDVFHVIGILKLVKVFPTEADAVTGLK